jgi:hypothetical protein
MECNELCALGMVKIQVYSLKHRTAASNSQLMRMSSHST